jgi:hypothetical protein
MGAEYYLSYMPFLSTLEKASSRPQRDAALQCRTAYVFQIAENPMLSFGQSKPTILCVSEKPGQQ